MDVTYSPGSFYKRFSVSNFRKLNRQAVEARVSEIGAAGTLIFGQTTSQSQQLSALAIQQASDRATTLLKEKQASVFDLQA